MGSDLPFREYREAPGFDEYAALALHDAHESLYRLDAYPEPYYAKGRSRADPFVGREGGLFAFYP